jgi:nucleoside diphosphate kinase
MLLTSLAVTEEMQKAGLHVRAMTEQTWDIATAEHFYEEHKG